METFLNDFGKAFFGGRNRQTCMSEGMCFTCGGEAKEFRDAISEKEYSISVMCQSCQDDVFKDPGMI
jgi:hypothetical protein